MTESSRWRRLLAVAFVVSCSACSQSDTAQDALARGDAYLDQNKRAEATIEYRKAIQLDPAFANARLKLAQTYEAMADLPNAYREFVRAADLLPEDQDLQVRASQYLLAAGNFEDAKARIKKVLAKNPDHVAAMIVLGNALAGTKDLAGGITQVEQALELDPTRVSSYANLAAFQLVRGETDEAAGILEKAVAAAPQSVIAHLNLGYLYWGLGRPEDAEKSYRRALEIDPNHLDTYRALATLYITSGRSLMAEPFVVRIAELSGTEEARLSLADYYLKSGQLGKATTILSTVTAGKRGHAVAQTRLAQLKYASGNHSEAFAMLDEVLKREPRNVVASLTKARWLLSDKKTDEALALAKATAATDPTSAQAQFILGEVHEARGESDDAIKAFLSVMQLNPKASAAAVRISRLEFARGSTQSAETFAQGAVDKAPVDASARSMLARSLIKRGEFKRAQAELAALEKQYPGNPIVITLRGHLRAATGDLAEAEGAFAEALQLAPDLAEASVGLVAVQLSRNKVTQARAVAERQVGTHGDSPALLMSAAQVSLAERDFDAAERTLRRVLEVSPSHLPAYTLLGYLYVAQGKLENAREEFERLATRQRPESAMPYTVVGMILEMQNRPGEARKYYEKALDVRGGAAAIAANNLASLYTQAGEKLPEALRLAQRAREELPGSSEVHDTLGSVYYKMNQLELAASSYEQAIKLSPRNPTLHYNLGRAFAKNNATDRARQSFEQALKLKPDYAEAQTALMTLKSLGPGDDCS